MKTVIDAVNCYKARYPFALECMFYEEGFGRDGFFAASPPQKTNANKYFVCLKSRFNQCVTELSHHKGKELFEEYLAADKTELTKESKVDYTSEEFWKDAPEGAEYYIKDSNDYVESFIKNVTETGYFFIGIGEANWTYQVTPVSLIDELVLVGIPRPQPKPVYTQAMADNGVQPCVGMKYLDEDNQLCMCLANYGDLTVGIMIEHVPVNEYLALSQTTVGNTKPIDTRTSKEKCADVIMNKIVIHSNRDSMYRTVMDIINLASDDEAYGLTFKGEEQ